MGYQLVAAALQPAWGRVLRDRDRLVLVAMCMAALDESDNAGIAAKRYWGGTGYLMLQVDGVNPSLTSDHRYKAASEGIRRSLRNLELAGAIKCVKKAANGRRAEYEITCQQMHLPVDDDSEKPEPAPPASGADTHQPVGLRPTSQWG